MWSQTQSPQECALFIFIFSYLIHLKTPFVDPMMCADLEQHRIKVSHRRTYGDTHHEVERAWRALCYFLDATNLTLEAPAWVPTAQQLGPVIWS